MTDAYALQPADTRTLGYGVAGSVLVHLLVFLLLAYWMGFEPVRRLVDIEPEVPVTLVFADSVVPAEPEPEAVPPQPPDSKRFIRTSQNTESENAPTNAAFISDRNTVASAKSAPSPDADMPVPNTTGVKLPTMDLANRDYRDGEPKNDSAPTPPPTPPAPPAQEASKPPEPEKPKEKPPEPEKPGEADAPPMLKAPEEDERPRKAIPVSQPPLPPSPSRPEKNAYQPETRVAEMRGSIGDRGSEDAVNAMMTVEGKYMAEIQKAVGIKWHRLIGPQRDLAKPGIFTVHFLVSPDGSVRPEDITILSDKDNVAIESVAVKAILTAKIPPVPRELRSALEKGRFSAGINFLIGL